MGNRLGGRVGNSQLHRTKFRLWRFNPITLTTTTSVPPVQGGKKPVAQWFTVFNPIDSLHERTKQFSEKPDLFSSSKSSVHGDF